MASLRAATDVAAAREVSTWEWADKLIGGADADRFIFATGHGKDTIKDFADGIDVIDPSGWKAVADFNDVKQHLTVSGDDLIIKAGNDWLTIDNLQKSDFTAADVDFVH
jgi:Ca2+-binding RTX toxin-like protein